MSPEYLQRFGGIARLYGQAALDRFAAAHVCVVGVGGVGSWAAEALARSGIGHLTLIDLDDICITNTNRQIHALQGTVGALKIEAMAARILAINPECQVTLVDDFITPDNLAEHLSAEFDYVVDAIDSIRAKVALVAWCKRHKLPVIVSGGAGGKTDPTQIRIDDLSRTTMDPLASRLRADLRRHHGFSREAGKRFGIDCVYSTEQLRYPDGAGGVCQSRAQSDGQLKMDCASGFGATTVVTASVGLAAVSRVLQRLAGSKG